MDTDLADVWLPDEAFYGKRGETIPLARHRRRHRSNLWLCEPCLAWWEVGRMQIAYVACKKLEPHAKDKVGALLRLNPNYTKWTASIGNVKTGKLCAFIQGAAWADDIKTKDYNYTRDEVDGPAAGRNIGYADLCTAHQPWQQSGSADPGVRN